MFAGDWFPIQVKQQNRVGRPDIDAFEAVMEREDRARGFFVAFGYTGDAEAEAAAFWKRTKRKITLISVQEILDEQHVQRLGDRRNGGPRALGSGPDEVGLP
ncbi:MAG: restriction endonuclease [Oscillatoriales cyanobacterium SM2_3_0]|nr:restriction endonuclease [Oscillatoriales cyanobacterium SM2_3_0]